MEATEVLSIAGILYFCYLLGSIPTAVWISKLFYGKDVRTAGSGNAGSTNMYRVFGWQAGLATQLIDVGKAMLAASMPLWGIAFLPGIFEGFEGLTIETQSLICGLAAVMGHIYPLFADFKGGKGVNTLLGMMLIVDPKAALVAIVVFLFFLLATRYVSMGSIWATLSFPVYLVVSAIFQQKSLDYPLIFAGIAMFLLTMYTHRANIRRLLAGTENRVWGK